MPVNKPIYRELCNMIIILYVYAEMSMTILAYTRVLYSTSKNFSASILRAIMYLNLKLYGALNLFFFFSCTFKIFLTEILHDSCNMLSHVLK